jgi:DNA polymerase I-like protein with 3'-5' exonuclease and polymerase domains
MLVSLDIETVCAVQGCPGFNDYKKCDHALSPWHNRITSIGVSSHSFDKFFTSTAGFYHWWTNRTEQDDVIGQNFKFDFLNLQVHGVGISFDRWYGCTQLMGYVLTEKVPDSFLADLNQRRKAAGVTGRPAGKHSLEAMAAYFLGVDPSWKWGAKDTEEYNLKDTRYTLELHRVLKAKLLDRGEFDFYNNWLLPKTKLLVRAELRGIQIDLDALAAKEKELQLKQAGLYNKLNEQWSHAHHAYHEMLISETKQKYATMLAAAKSKKGVGGFTIKAFSRYKELESKAIEKLPRKISFESPTQMLWLLKDYLGYDVTSLEGDEGTGREILERLANEGKEDVKVYLEWRKTQKLLTAFLPTYKDLQTDGTLHPIYNPSNTRTGRTSSERANLQQVPPELRKLFKARDGYKLISYDAAAIEARIIAEYTSDPVLTEVVRSGVSLHDQNTKIFFGFDEPIDAIKHAYPNERAASKNVGFALFYNAGVNRIRIAFAQKGYHLTEGQCRQILNRFRSSYRTAYEYAKELVAHMEAGNVFQNLVGRPLRIENPEDAYMTAFNMLIQSSASDIILEAADRAQKEYDRLGLDAHVILFVHDMLAVEARSDIVELAEQILIKSMTDFPTLEIPLAVEGGVSVRWEK